ncbi:hypothetical protein AwDysgo_04010 [Bacteroidales bacterium]|nr:hypothetical protein AwDysgo_04010 [Bacteroidales bacterium]
MAHLKKLPLFLFFLLSTLSASADEGMWMLNNLKADNWDAMRKLGFSLSPDELSSSQESSLKDAIVHFDGGCTGVSVSNKGLIFTNHHCGFDAIQSQSSLEHDYLKDGFVAANFTDEIAIPNMIIRYLIKTENITPQIMAAVDSISDEYERLKVITDMSIAIEDSINKDQEFILAEVSSYFDRNEYYINIYEVFKDIRMVFAPPSSVGKFGGDTDNWMWPRHTGDFSAFRVYANADNRAANYSADNSPYKPKNVAPISLNGYNENDFCMTIGFPGRTNRYLSSWGISQRVNSSNMPRIEARGIKQELWKEAMLRDDATRIKYASKYARSSNYWKNSIGMNRGIEKMQVVERKESLEKDFSDWLDAQSAEKQELYGEALPLVKEAYTASTEIQEALTYLYETITVGTEITRLAFAAMSLNFDDTAQEQATFFNEEILPAYKNYDAKLDQKVLAAMLQVAQKRISPVFLPQIFKDIEKKYKGDMEKYAAHVFSTSVVPYPDKLEEALLNPKKAKKLKNDPAYLLAASIRESLDASFIASGLFSYDILKGERLFFAGLREMYPEKNLPSDANSSMRMSYGSVSPYKPFDGAWYDYYTTTKGIFEKYKKDDSEFHLQPEILELFKKKDFGRYANEDGDLNVCFISNNDITGGNSGSPMFDGKGRVIGLAFDGNWEAMSGDIVFEPEVQKTIGVDIRYVLFIMEKWGKSERLLDELLINCDE